MYVLIDQGECIGCGSCEAVCDEVFRMNQLGLAEAYAECNEANKAQCDEAIKFCPVRCISYDEE